MIENQHTNQSKTRKPSTNNQDQGMSHDNSIKITNYKGMIEIKIG